MSDDTIRNLFDTNPNLTLAQLSRISGKPVSVLKKILMK